VKHPSLALRWDWGHTLALLFVLAALVPALLNWLGVIHLGAGFDPTVGP
jgi:hypothetical protein